MSEEEIIDIVKKEITNSYAERKAKALQGLLDLYNEEKEKNVTLNEAYIGAIKESKKWFDKAKDSISKDKIREKIEKLENEFYFYAGRDPYEWDDSEFDGDRCDTLGQQIKVLKELLEEVESYEKDKF